MPTDHLVYAAKELLRNALQSNGARVITHGFGANGADVSFEIYGKYFSLTLQLTEVPEMKPPTPLPPVRARRALAR
jgi:hypothetical protein